MDRRRPRRRQRHGDPLAGLQRHCARPRQRRRRIAAAATAHAALSAPQAARPVDRTRRSERPAHALPATAPGASAPDQRRPARLQHRGAHPPHQRRCARPLARTAGDRLAAALSRARARLPHPGKPRRAARRHHHRGHSLWADRSDAGPRARLESVAQLLHSRRKEPRGAQCARLSGTRGRAADPRLVRAVSTRRFGPRRDRGGAHAGLARTTRRPPDRALRGGFLRAARGAARARRQGREGRPARDQGPAPKLRRKFHGARRVDRPPPPAGPARAGLVTDRKGRRVLVQRFGEAAAAAAPQHDARRPPRRPSGKPRRRPRKR
jgi:hypothetical protein